MEIDWEPLRQIIDRHQRFVVISHIRPDGDALGSELALALLLRNLGKDARVVSVSPTPARLAFLDPQQQVQLLGTHITEEEVQSTEVMISVDTSAWVQLSDLGRCWKKSPSVKVVIDHHISADDLGASEFKDTTAEAAGALVFRLAEAMQWPLTAEIATLLYCAIATDTGWFRFSATTSRTMRAIGVLIDAGAQPPVLYEKLYENCTPGRVRLAGRVLGRVKLECAGRVAYTFVRYDDFVETQSESSDTEDLVNECLKIGGTYCAFILIEQPNRQVKVSLRSRTTLDVAAVAEKFRGGGHKQAAGAMVPGPIAEATQNILNAVKAALEA